MAQEDAGGLGWGHHRTRARQQEPIRIEQTQPVHCKGNRWLLRASSPFDADTCIAILGSMHLRDAWIDVFGSEKERLFECGDGITVMMPFMVGSGQYDLLEQNGAITLGKRLTSRAQMVIAMPKETLSLEDYITSGQAWLILQRMHRASSLFNGADAKSICRL